jgi:hypothetical protein
MGRTPAALAALVGLLLLRVGQACNAHQYYHFGYGCRLVNCATIYPATPVKDPANQACIATAACLPPRTVVDDTCTAAPEAATSATAARASTQVAHATSTDPTGPAPRLNRTTLRTTRAVALDASSTTTWPLPDPLNPVWPVPGEHENVSTVFNVTNQHSPQGGMALVEVLVVGAAVVALAFLLYQCCACSTRCCSRCCCCGCGSDAADAENPQQRRHRPCGCLPGSAGRRDDAAAGKAKVGGLCGCLWACLGGCGKACCGRPRSAAPAPTPQAPLVFGSFFPMVNREPTPSSGPPVVQWFRMAPPPPPPQLRRPPRRMAPPPPPPHDEYITIADATGLRQEGELMEGEEVEVLE